MAQQAVTEWGLSMRRVCRLFSLSETCYRYRRTLSDDNALITDWLLRLAHTHRRWGFGLCFLYLRNVQGCRYNHKRVCRIYRELELNLRRTRMSNALIARCAMSGLMNTCSSQLNMPRKPPRNGCGVTMPNDLIWR